MSPAKPLDPAIYQLAPQPWPYGTVAGYLKSWGYKPVGDHTPEYLLNPEGFVVWERIDPKTGQRQAFVVSNPRWRAHGINEPVWPGNVIATAMRAQEVYHRFDEIDVAACDVISLKRKEVAPTKSQKSRNPRAAGS